jgi:CubicO group peptidase (beta-lactamase class C family)
MLSRVRGLAGAWLLLLAQTAAATSDEVDQFMQRQLKTRRLPGASVAVVRNGSVVKATGYGYAHLELESPASPDTVYQLASVSKQFTSAAILLLVQDGNLSLDDKLRRHVPEAPEGWEPVTLRHLLQHTSGVKSYSDLPNFTTLWRSDPPQSEVLKTLFEYPLLSPPGEKYAYNNGGYFLLGIVVERASGVPYGKFLEERIFRPLGMTSTRLNDPYAVIKGRADGYELAADTLRLAPYASPHWSFSAGGIVSTVVDLAKWDAALCGTALLTDASKEQMWNPGKLSDGTPITYGLGWAVGRYAGRRLIGHGGARPGFSTYIGRFVDDKLTVIVLTNRSGGGAEAIARELAAFYIDDLKEARRKALAQGERLLGIARSALAELASGKPTSKVFAASMLEALRGERLEEIRKFLSPLGEPVSVEAVDFSDDAAARVLSVSVKYAAGTALLEFRIGADNRVTGVVVSG